MSQRLRVTALFLFVSGCHFRHGGGFDDDFDERGRERRCDDERGDFHGRPREPGGRGGPGIPVPPPGPATDGGVIARAGDGGSDSGAGSMVGSTGYCGSDAMCGDGLVCDKALGACALPRGGCGTAAFQPTRTTGEMVLVLDRSNSMRDSTPSGSKWADLTASIDGVLGRRAEVVWGLSLFPASDARACLTAPLRITPAAGTATAISAAIHGSSPTGSGTPTRQALKEAGDEILASGRPTRKYLLLATDGEPNCLPGAADQSSADVEGTTGAIRALAEQGVTTFVLGVAVHDASAAALTTMAQAGGHARQGMTAYYTASDATELEGSLDEVARQIALCTFDLSPPPPAGTALGLSIGGQAFARNITHVGDGWDVTGAGKAIELYGAACDAVQAGGAIQLSYACGAGSQCDQAAMACVATPMGVP
jgi:hypothetical protein